MAISTLILGLTGNILTDHATNRSKETRRESSATIYSITLNSVLSEMKLHNILANSSCVWLCPSCGLSSVTDLLPEASLDKQNSFSSLESLSPELFFATSSSNGTNHGSSNGANNRTNDKSCKPSSHHRQALSFKFKKVSRQ